MGGTAFSAILTTAAFPRLPPLVYRSLKARLFPKLFELYNHVEVPREAPEKLNHGDLDFLVANPKHPHVETVPHEVVRKLIGAHFMNPMDGNRTSNYAVPVQMGEWSEIGHAKEEERFRDASEDRKIFYQVDVHVCSDKAEWDRIVFFHSYGDFGMILGLVVRNTGLALGEKGLKIPDPPNPPFELSTSFDEITRFLGLPIDTYSKGFETKSDVFQWVASSKYFNPRIFRSHGPGIRSVKADRTMYAEFVEWVEERKSLSQVSLYESLYQEDREAKVRDEALEFFKKKEEFEARAKVRNDRVMLKQSFSGSSVREWTGMGGYWKGVKIVMDEVRLRMGGEAEIANFLEVNPVEDLKAIVLQVQAKLKVYPETDACTRVASFHDSIVTENLDGTVVT